MAEIVYLDPTKIKTDPDSPFNDRITEEMVQSMAQNILAGEMISPGRIDSKGLIVIGEVRRRAVIRAKELAPERADEILFPSIIWEGDETDRLFMQTSENLLNFPPSSVQHENAIYRLWKSERWATINELARDLGYKVRTGSSPLHDIIRAKEFRDKYDIDNVVSTTAIRLTEGASPEQRVAILQGVAEGTINVREISSYVRAAQQSQILFEAAIEGTIDLDRIKQTTEIIKEVKERGVEVTETMVVELVGELKQDSNVISRHEERLWNEVTAIMLGEKEPPKGRETPIIKGFRSVKNRMMSWTIPVFETIPKSDWEEARTILHTVRDRAEHLLQVVFGEITPQREPIEAEFKVR